MRLRLRSDRSLGEAAADMGTSSTGRKSPVLAASAVQGVRTLATMVLPAVARGAIVRRRRMVALVERLDTDRRAVRQMRRVRDRYARDPCGYVSPVVS